MPEIPDLETFARNLNKILKGKTVSRTRGGIKTAKGTKASPTLFSGQAFKKVKRDGKRLHFSIGDHVLAVHLMLHGEFYFVTWKEKTRFSRLEILFTDETRLVVADWQKSAHAVVDPPPEEVPDVLSRKMSMEYFRSVLSAKREIKTVLRDQSKIRGLGNAYTDEILWEARISPFSIASAIPAKKAEDLYRAIRTVLKWAIATIRKKDPDRITGELRDFLKVHNAKKDKSPTGCSILREKKGGSSTYYTKEQKLYK